MTVGTSLWCTLVWGKPLNPRLWNLASRNYRHHFSYGVKHILISWTTRAWITSVTEGRSDGQNCDSERGSPVWQKDGRTVRTATAGVITSVTEGQSDGQNCDSKRDHQCERRTVGRSELRQQAWIASVKEGRSDGQNCDSGCGSPVWQDGRTVRTATAGVDRQCERRTVGRSELRQRVWIASVTGWLDGQNYDSGCQCERRMVGRSELRQQ